MIAAIVSTPVGGPSQSAVSGPRAIGQMRVFSGCLQFSREPTVAALSATVETSSGRRCDRIRQTLYDWRIDRMSV
jgi:hypothetical protein